MGKRQYNDAKHIIMRFLAGMDIKAITAILAMELGIFLLVAYKGYAAFYLPVTLILMGFTILGCSFAFHTHADKYLLVMVLILLNIGFMVQQIQAGANLQIRSFLIKFVVAIVTAIGAAVVYQRFGDLLSKDFMIFFLMGFQLFLSAVMVIFGQVVGTSEQSASITLAGITPFEIVKILYIFVAAGLLCKEEKVLSVGKITVKKEILLVVHTAILAVCFLLCRELGSLLIIYFSGLLFLISYGENRKLIVVLAVLSVAGFLGFWFLCDKMLYPMLLQNRISLPGAVNKVVQRFGTALHPENTMSTSGYQGTLGLEAIAIGGLLGISSEKYRLALPEAQNDYVFANVVQTCGMIMGIIMLLCFFALLKRGIEIAALCEDLYFQGLAAGITIMITVETVVHVGYNIGFLPITGIPLFFVSQGFTAVIVGMTLISVLLVISTGKMKRQGK